MTVTNSGSEGSTSSFQAFVHLIKGNIGPGCLALPFAYSKMEWKWGILVTLLIGMISTFNSFTLLRLKQSFSTNFSGSGFRSQDLGEEEKEPLFKDSEKKKNYYTQQSLEDEDSHDDIGVTTVAASTNINNRYLNEPDDDDDDDSGSAYTSDNSSTSVFFGSESGDGSNGFEQQNLDLSYPELGHLAFGSFGTKMVQTSILVQQLSVCTVYFSFIADNIVNSFPTTEHPSIWYQPRIIMLLTLPCILILTSKPDFRFLSPISQIATLLLLVAYGLLIIVGIENWHVEDLNLSSLSSYYSSPSLQMDDNLNLHTERKDTSTPLEFIIAMTQILYSFEGVCLVLPIESGMRTKKHAIPVYLSAMVTVAGLYIVFTTFCVFAFGDITDGSITAYLNANIEYFSGKSLIIAANYVIVAVVFLTYPLQLYPCLDLAYSDRDDGSTKTKAIIYRTGLILSTFLVAVLVPNVGMIIGLAGSLAGSASALILPPLLELKLSLYSHMNKDKGYALWLKRILNWIILFFGIALGALGATCSLIQTIRTYK